jgi:hypothetical protein
MILHSVILTGSYLITLAYFNKILLPEELGHAVQSSGPHSPSFDKLKNSETSLRLPAPSLNEKFYGLLNTSDASSRKVKGNAAKRRRSSGLKTQGLRRASQDASVPAARKQRSARTSLQSHAEHYRAPIGCRWSQNSCAYDAVFTSVFVLWCSNRQYWTKSLKGMGNEVADLLIHGFTCYEKGEALLEDARDNARRLIARSTNGLPFGHNTSIENVSNRFLSTNKVVSERYYICPNGHYVRHSEDSVAVLSQGVHGFGSIAQWVSAETHHAEARCHICRHAVSIKLRF